MNLIGWNRITWPNRRLFNIPMIFYFQINHFYQSCYKVILTEFYHLNSLSFSLPVKLFPYPNVSMSLHILARFLLYHFCVKIRSLTLATGVCIWALQEVQHSFPDLKTPSAPTLSCFKRRLKLICFRSLSLPMFLTTEHWWSPWWWPIYFLRLSEFFTIWMVCLRFR